MKFLKTITEYILSIILPKEEEVIFIETLTEEDIVAKIPYAKEINTKYMAIFQYQNQIIKKAIWEIKYNANKVIISKFSKILYEFILENISDKIMFNNLTNPLLIPIPASKLRIREKGFNQCELIVKEICKLDNNTNFVISTNALSKIKETKQQSKIKNRSKRLNNLSGCFLANEAIVKNKNIILIDDVITTGKTMEEASKALYNAGAKKVIGFSIAH